jgi:hypothetical protein
MHTLLGSVIEANHLALALVSCDRYDSILLGHVRDLDALFTRPRLI